MESKGWTKNCFVTLTYNNALDESGKTNLPINEKVKMTLKKKDLQDFMKRLRYYEKGNQYWENPKNKKLEQPIRYFACGEYGPTNGRPHYHMALFNYMPTDLKPYKKNHNGDMLYMSPTLQKIWGKGFVIIGHLTPESASYIARYVQKKAYGYDNKHYEKKGLEGEFVETSRKGGIAYQLIEDKEQFKKMKRNMGIFVWNKNKDKQN